MALLVEAAAEESKLMIVGQGFRHLNSAIIEACAGEKSVRQISFKIHLEVTRKRLGGLETLQSLSI